MNIKELIKSISKLDEKEKDELFKYMKGNRARKDQKLNFGSSIAINGDLKIKFENICADNNTYANNSIMKFIRQRMRLKERDDMSKIIINEHIIPVTKGDKKC